MDFAFTEDQEQIGATARRFADEKLAPFYQAREKETSISRDLMREMGSLGLIGVDLPEEFGGLSSDSITAGLVMENIASGDMNVAYVQLLGSLMGSIMCRYAPRELAKEVVGDICAGKSLVALGLTEPRGGSDAGNLILKAERDSKGGYVLNGEKTSISLVAQADSIILLARTGNAGASGVTGFFVPFNLPGISRTTFTDLGSKIIGRGSVFFDNVRIPAEYKIGDEGAGFRQVMQGFDYSRALIGLQVLAPAWESLQETWKYATERKAFGHPIAKFQGVTEPLAEAETLLSACRLLCYRTLWLRDRQKPHTSEAAMCKWWVPKTSFETIHRCLLTHGHGGWSMDLPHQQRLRDVMGLQIGDGTEQIQKMIIAREKVGRVAVPY